MGSLSLMILFLRPVRAVLLLSITLICAGPLDGVDPDSARPVTFKASSRLVEMAVVVRGGEHGQIIGNLRVSDFSIRDNGTRRPIASFASGLTRPPLRLVFLIEASGAQTNAVNGLLDALPKALQILHETDAVGVANVFPGYKIVLEPTKDRTAVPEALELVRENQQEYVRAQKDPNKRRRPKFSFDDLSRALVEISNREADPDKRAETVIVVVTDDFDLLNPSQSADAASLLLKNGTLVAAFIDRQNPGIAIADSYMHAVHTVTPLRFGLRDRGASYFAGETGGPVIRVRDRDYLAALRQLLDVVAGSYLIGFVPPEAELDGTFHKLRVTVNRPDLKRKVRVTCRRGFWAEP